MSRGIRTNKAMRGIAALLVTVSFAQSRAIAEPSEVECATLIYARTRAAVCFSGRFLSKARQDTSIPVDPKLRSVKLADEQIFRYPFVVMSGERAFQLEEAERVNLRNYLLRGGFLLASAGCTNRAWDKSFRAEIKNVFPESVLERLSIDHPVFRTIYDIQAIRLRHGRGGDCLEGMKIGGRIALIYSEFGLNSTDTIRGCCCCGGNEIQNAEEIKVNILAYALLH